MSKSLTAYKGFNTDWTCRDFQYEVGETYEHEGPISACHSGFHACEHPLNVFEYYAPAQSEFALVELSGDLDRKDGGDTKVAASKITITAGLQLSELVDAAVNHVFGAAKWLKKSSATKPKHAASATGYQGAASATGGRGAASATGDQGAALASGFEGKVLGKEGCALFLCERSVSGEILHVWAGIAGKDGIKPDTWYTLVDGTPVEKEAA
jgi:hypothetical protein